MVHVLKYNNNSSNSSAIPLTFLTISSTIGAFLFRDDESTNVRSVTNSRVITVSASRRFSNLWPNNSVSTPGSDDKRQAPDQVCKQTFQGCLVTKLYAS